MKRTIEMASEIAEIMPVIFKKIVFDLFAIDNIPHSQMLFILKLYRAGPMQLNQLSKEFEISAPSVTGIVDRLEKSGFVKRIRDKKDRRAINIELTKKGINSGKKITNAIISRWKEILDSLPYGIAENYYRSLKEIQKVI